MQEPVFKLPSILPSSDSIVQTDRPSSVQLSEEKTGRCQRFDVTSTFSLVALRFCSLIVFSVSIKSAAQAYEEWRANIHRELEEDLQRQVQLILDESERQERLDRLNRLQLG